VQITEYLTQISCRSCQPGSYPQLLASSDYPSCLIHTLDEQMPLFVRLEGASMVEA
jgi:hypothetical protein